MACLSRLFKWGVSHIWKTSHICVWHALFICVTYVWRVLFICVTFFLQMVVTTLWLRNVTHMNDVCRHACMCDMPYSYVWHMCDMSHSHVCRSKFKCVTYTSFHIMTVLIQMVVTTHTYEWQVLFIHMTFLIHICDMPHSYVWYSHDSWVVGSTHYSSSSTRVMYLFAMCVMTHDESWLMTHSHKWHASFICVTFSRLLSRGDQSHTSIFLQRVSWVIRISHFNVWCHSHRDTSTHLQNPAPCAIIYESSVIQISHFSFGCHSHHEHINTATKSCSLRYQ